MLTTLKKIREASLGWLGQYLFDIGTHNMEVSGHRQIGRPKSRWSEVIRKTQRRTLVQREAQYRRTMRQFQIWKRLKKTLADEWAH